MSNPVLYNGLWPRNVSKTAKYAIRMNQNEWKVTVYLDIGDGMKALIVEGNHFEIIKKVNEIKLQLNQNQGGVFYINEYRHLLVPVKIFDTSYYYFGGKVDTDFQFEFENEIYTTKPESRDGSQLNAGEKWLGPRPGIPYFLSAGGTDIKYRRLVLTDDNPPKVRKNVEQTVSLLNVCENRNVAEFNISLVRKVKGTRGGRFYVNENCALFAPVNDGDGDGWNFLYCGELNMSGWFPEPILPMVNN